MTAEPSPIPGVRLLPSDPRDMVPSAVRWAYAVQASIRTVPAQELMRPARTSLTAVVWVLAAADYDDRIPADHTAAMLAAEWFGDDLLPLQVALTAAGRMLLRSR